MYIRGSSRTYPTYEEYEKSGKFSSGQLYWILKGFNINLTPRDISLYAQPEFTPDQMEEIYDGFNCELDFRDILLYARPEFDGDQMNEIKMGIWSYELDHDQVLRYADPAYGADQMNVIRNIIFCEDGNYPQSQLDSLLNLICHPEYSVMKIKTLYHLFESDADPKILEYVQSLDLSDQAMYWVKRGFEEKLTLEQVQSYVKPSASNEWMRDRFYTICHENKDRF